MRLSTTIAPIVVLMSLMLAPPCALAESILVDAVIRQESALEVFVEKFFEELWNAKMAPDLRERTTTERYDYYLKTEFTRPLGREWQFKWRISDQEPDWAVGLRCLDQAGCMSVNFGTTGIELISQAASDAARRILDSMGIAEAPVANSFTVIRILCFGDPMIPDRASELRKNAPHRLQIHLLKLWANDPLRRPEGLTPIEVQTYCHDRPDHLQRQYRSAIHIYGSVSVEPHIVKVYPYRGKTPMAAIPLSGEYDEMWISDLAYHIHKNWE